MRWWGILARALLALVLVAFVALVFVLGQRADWDAVKASVIVQQFWDQYSTLIDRIYTALDKTVRLVTPIGTLLGIAYGIYHKWQYSRSRMHIHIRSFLERDNPRLETTRDNLKEAHQPPGAARDLSQSIFSSAEVQRKLKLMRWGRRLSKADELLDEELGKIGAQYLIVNYSTPAGAPGEEQGFLEAFALCSSSIVRSSSCSSLWKACIGPGCFRYFWLGLRVPCSALSLSPESCRSRCSGLCRSFLLM